jgi:hypothetical protein
VAAREGAKAWLRTLPGLVVSGGVNIGELYTSAVWRLDLGELRWELISDLTLARRYHACCAVRGGVVVLGGLVEAEDASESEEENETTVPSVEVLGYDSEAEEKVFKALPPLSCGPRAGAGTAAILESESESEQGQVLLIGGFNGRVITPEVHTVDLATGVCTPLPPLLSSRRPVCTAAQLLDGRVVCVGKKLGDAEGITAEILEELPDQGSLTSAASWRWRELPGMSVARIGCGGCVLSDGRFAVFGGMTALDNATSMALCEVLHLDGDDER